MIENVLDALNQQLQLAQPCSCTTTNLDYWL